MRLIEINKASVFHCGWDGLLEQVPACDALITDTPYSAKTHSGHDGGVVDLDRRSIQYRAWAPDDVQAFVDAWHPRVRGWIVSITDDQLAPVWSAALESVGRYVFAWLPYVAPGSRVRLLGDGPSSWTTWIVVARPRSREFATWGTLPGAYVLPAGYGGAMPVVGGKPVWLMQRLVEDYSRPGALICDPCCGAGTTGIGALRSERRVVMGDALRAHADLAALWVQHPYRPAPTIEREDAGKPQLSLLGSIR